MINLGTFETAVKIGLVIGEEIIEKTIILNMINENNRQKDQNWFEQKLIRFPIPGVYA